MHMLVSFEKSETIAKTKQKNSLLFHTQMHTIEIENKKK
jgi:hypothetical protein